MSHRVREAMKDGHDDKLGGPETSGSVEADETHFGQTKGLGKGAHPNKKQKVVAPVERKGRVRSFHMPTITAETGKPVLQGQIEQNVRLMTDGAGLYEKIGKTFASHETVNHAAGEYARGDVTTNTVEGFFGILKMGIGGVYQHVSPQHFHRYLSEVDFRYSNRKKLGIEDGERAAILLQGVVGKRLTYQTVVA